MGLENFLNDRITKEDSFTYTITDILKFRAEKTPSETAFVFLKDGDNEEERITYMELYNQSMSIAKSLVASGIKSGERALMLYPPGLEFVKALFGCFYAGIYAVPAYPPRKNRSLNRIVSIVNDSKSSVCMTIETIQNTFEKNFADVTELSSLKWLSVDGDIDNKSDIKISPAITQDNIALLQYTSGSTGDPKGVMITHQNICRNSEYIRQSFELSSESVSVCWLPSFHDMGLIDGVLQPVYTGFPGVLIPPVAFLQKPVRWLQAITKYKGTHCGGPNFGYDLCAEKITEEEKQSLDLSSLSTLYNGAEPIRKSSLTEFSEAFASCGFKEKMFYPCYGMAETTLIITGGKENEDPVYLPVDAASLENHKVVVSKETEKASYHVGVGFPWIDTEVIIVNPETLKKCEHDEVGEIWVSGSIVARGYWDNDVATKEAFHCYTADTNEGPFLRTGDLGFFQNEELYVSGRIKDLIIVHGRNYYPQDIEIIAEEAHPAIRPNCVAAFSIEKDEEEHIVITAEVERTYMRDLNADDIAEKIRIAVADEMELEIFAIQLLRTASIPKTSSGKIQRQACKKGFLESSLNEVGTSILESKTSRKPADNEASLVSLQAWLMAWLSVKLKIDIATLDVTKPITAYGLNSIKAVELQSAFLDRYGVDFPPYLFFQKISIQELTEKAFELIERLSD